MNGHGSRGEPLGWFTAGRPASSIASPTRPGAPTSAAGSWPRIKVEHGGVKGSPKSDAGSFERDIPLGFPELRPPLLTGWTPKTSVKLQRRAPQPST